MAGILDLVGLAAVLAFAIPVGLFGVTLLAEGDPLGAAFVVVAVAMVGLKHYLTTPEDVPARAAERVAGAVAKTDDEQE